MTFHPKKIPISEYKLGVIFKNFALRVKDSSHRMRVGAVASIVSDSLQPYGL